MEIESETVPAVTAACMGLTLEKQSDVPLADERQGGEEHAGCAAPLKAWKFLPFPPDGMRTHDMAVPMQAEVYQWQDS